MRNEKNKKERVSKAEKQKYKFYREPENSKGITLIALIITIIIMLILVSVSISIAINSGLFRSAGKATKDTKNALNAEQELAGGKVKIGGIVYNSIEEYTKLAQGGSVSKIIGKEQANNTNLNSNNIKEVVQTRMLNTTYEAPIPVGFTVSGKESERSITGGLVIYLIDDKTEEEIAAINWEDAETVANLQKTYDQFVWIPIKNETDVNAQDINDMYICQAKTASNGVCNIKVNAAGEVECQTHKTVDDGTKSKLMAGRLYAAEYEDKFEQGYTEVYAASNELREPDIITGTDGADYDNKTDNLTQLNAILGTSFAPTIDTENNTGTANTDFKTYLQEEYNEIVKSVYQNQGFYIGRYETSGMVNTDTNPTIKVVSGTTTGITNVTWYRMYAQQKKYAENKRLTGVKSTMIQGTAYDQVMKFVEGGKRTDGNTYTIKKIGNVGHSAEQGAGRLYQTGGLNYKVKTEPMTDYKAYNDCVKNIYDLEGNVRTWTTEIRLATCRVGRGGNVIRSDSSVYRSNINSSSSYSYLGSVSQLYVVL